MKTRKEIILLLEMYHEGKYNTEDFCELFIDAYFFSSSAYRCFHGEERKVLDELAAVAERYSDNIENAKNEMDVHIAEKNVKEKFYEVLKVLNF